MNTVIVPVDFSETSLHAAKYAAQLLVGHYGVTLILYHSYSKAADKDSIDQELEALKNQPDERTYRENGNPEPPGR
jgi:hypothetical protein